MSEVLLIFPKLGSEDVFIKDPPLSIVYAAADAVKRDYQVTILDLRLHHDWKKELLKHFSDSLKVVGISVYTGNPITMALEISSMVKKHTRAAVVWGGPHPTIDAETTVRDAAIDYLVRGYGSRSFALLLDYIYGRKSEITDIPGVSYKQEARIYHNSLAAELELIKYRDIPYHLIAGDLHRYGRLSQDEVLIPIFTSMGCPYHCTFCISPIVHGHMKTRWQPFPPDEIIGHIRMLKEQYGATHISVYDDDAFIDLERMELLMDRFVKERFNIRLSFRGARINELEKASDRLLSLLAMAGTAYIQIGVESGSDRMLKLMKKGITAPQIIRVNRNLARFPGLTPMYNFMTGLPGETLADARLTADLMTRLRADNPICFINFPGKYKPQPGSELFQTALAHGLRRPAALREWVYFDTGEEDIYFPWYDRKFNRFIQMLQVCSYFFDDKITREISSTTWFNRLIRFAHWLYHPVAVWRIKNKNDRVLLEYYALRLFRWIMNP